MNNEGGGEMKRKRNDSVLRFGIAAYKDTEVIDSHLISVFTRVHPWLI